MSQGSSAVLETGPRYVRAPELPYRCGTATDQESNAFSGLAQMRCLCISPYSYLNFPFVRCPYVNVTFTPPNRLESDGCVARAADGSELGKSVQFKNLNWDRGLDAVT